MKKGCPYGTHRVISPKGVLPQPADVIDNTMEIYDNEVLIEVHTLNIDSASFTEIERRAEGDIEEIKKIIMNIVETTGKHKNPWTGSGGMLIGTVKEIGLVLSVLLIAAIHGNTEGTYRDTARSLLKLRICCHVADKNYFIE